MAAYPLYNKFSLSITNINHASSLEKGMFVKRLISRGIENLFPSIENNFSNTIIPDQFNRINISQAHCKTLTSIFYLYKTRVGTFERNQLVDLLFSAETRG